MTDKEQYDFAEKTRILKEWIKDPKPSWSLIPRPMPSSNPLMCILRIFKKGDFWINVLLSEEIEDRWHTTWISADFTRSILYVDKKIEILTGSETWRFRRKSKGSNDLEWIMISRVSINPGEEPTWFCDVVKNKFAEGPGIDSDEKDKMAEHYIKVSSDWEPMEPQIVGLVLPILEKYERTI